MTPLLRHALDEVRGHHESDAEYYGRREVPVRDGMVGDAESMKPPEGVNPVLTVAIQVTLGGWTGQRDEWEAHTSNYSVSADGPMITLAEQEGTIRHTITFHKDGLEAALKILEDYGR